MKIPPCSGQLDIGFAALSFTAPERLRFRYHLVGRPDSLVEAGSARVARYSYLPPGKYEFQVTACHEGGPWNETWATLRFTPERAKWVAAEVRSSEGTGYPATDVLAGFPGELSLG